MVGYGNDGRVKPANPLRSGAKQAGPRGNRVPHLRLSVPHRYSKDTTRALRMRPQTPAPPLLPRTHSAPATRASAVPPTRRAHCCLPASALALSARDGHPRWSIRLVPHLTKCLPESPAGETFPDHTDYISDSRPAQGPRGPFSWAVTALQGTSTTYCVFT